ncbi:MAG TPA: hypothetical protein VFV02_08365 [Acidimicrobiales bacterium]|nr:hypothetical protein [Acidimicrobiales bacterium]
MTTTEIVQIVVAASIPIVTAVLGVLGIMFQDWRARRTQAGRHKLALEEASRQVSFAAEWWNARRLLADSPEAMQEATSRTLAWLEEASALVMESRPPPSEVKPPITVRRLLLLSDPFQRRAAKIIRGVFYASLGLLVLSTGTVISATLKASERQYLWDSVVVLALIGLFALGSRFSAGFVAKQRPEHRKRRRATIRRSLLFYRLHGPAANIVRILFYAWIALAAWVAFNFSGNVSEDPSSLPIGVAVLTVLIGYAAVFRYWAASLGTTSEAKEASTTRSSHTTLHEPQS